MEQGIKIKFGNYQQLPITRDGFDFLFHFTTVDLEYVGAPEEFRMVESHQLVVDISPTLKDMWALQGLPLVKTLFELGKRHLVEKVKDGTLTSKIELQLATSNSSNQAPFDTNRIPDPKGVEVVVPMDNQTLVRLRQGYPVHVDTADGVRNAHKFLGVGYPITEFRAAWLTLLNEFLKALKHIKEAIEKDNK